MKEKVMDKIGRVLESPYATLFVGLILLSTSMFEIWDTIYDDVTRFSLKGNHGVAVFGFYNILKSIPEIYHGLEVIKK